MSCKPDKNGSWKRLSEEHYLNTKTCEEIGIRKIEPRSNLYLAYTIQKPRFIKEPYGLPEELQELKRQDLSSRPESKTNAIATLKNYMQGKFVPNIFKEKRIKVR